MKKSNNYSVSKTATMKTTIEIIVVCVCLFLVAQPTISWPPLRIHFDKAYLAIGIILIMLGTVFILAQGKVDGRLKYYKEGLKKGAEMSHEAAVEAAKQLIEESKNQPQ